jgi:hypothetical protein
MAIGKRARQSGLKINMELAKLDKWTEQEITDRAKYLTSVALKIWEI